MADLVSIFIRFGAEILLGGVIIVVGFWLSNLAYGAIVRVSGAQAIGVASVARFGILGLVIAMGLRQMGLAEDIVNLAFGLTLGAVAVAIALSFGLGGREAAGRQMEHWLKKLRGECRVVMQPSNECAGQLFDAPLHLARAGTACLLIAERAIVAQLARPRFIMADTVAAYAAPMLDAANSQFTSSQKTSTYLGRALR